MNKNLRVLGLAAVGIAALLISSKADAVCGNISFGSYYSNVVGTTNSPTLRSSFWLFGGGNPTLGAGADNGAINETDNWLVPYGGGIKILGNWGGAQGGTLQFDGCPDPPSGPATDQRMIFAFSDVNGTGAMTYAVVCKHRDPAAGTQFDVTQAASGPITLAVAPKGVVSNTVRAGTDATVTIASPDFSPGFFGDGVAGCEAATVIPQYDVYKQQLARGGSAVPSRDTTAWTLVGTGNTGTPFSFNTGCGAVNCDVVVAVTPHYNNNFGTGEPATASPARVGVNSNTIQAGPTLAVTPKAKVIQNKKIGGE